MAVSAISRHGPEAASGPRDRPLAWHLAVLCLALALPILILAAVLARSYVGSERARLEQEALRIAHQVTAACDLELNGLIATAKVLALSPALERGDLDAFDAQARDIYRQSGVNVVLRDRESRQLLNARVPRGVPLSTAVDPEPDRVVAETKRPFVSNLFIGAVAAQPLFIVNVPVLRSGEVAYFLSLRVTPERIREIIVQTGLAEGWTAAVADRRGVVIAHSSRQEAMLNRPLPILSRRETASREGVVRGDEAVDDQQSVLTAFSRSQFSGWIAVVTAPTDQVTAPLRRSLVGLSGVGAAILVLAVGLALIFSLRIKGPVGALAVQAARLGRGEAMPPLTTPVREVNALSNALSAAAREREATDAAQKAAEAALRDSEARLKLAQTAGRSGTWDWDIASGHAICSETYCRLYGLDPKGPGHQSPEAWLAQVHPDDRDRVMNVWQGALASGRLESEYRIVRPDGSVRWIVDRGISIFDAQGRPTRFIGVNVDVTERRGAEQRLRELQLELLHASRLSAMGQMAAALAHELNQPLGAATNFLSAARLALKSARPDAPARALARIERAAEQTVRAGAILGRLRDFVARGETEKRIVSAPALLEDAVALALVGAKDRNLRLRFDFAPDARPILADRVQIQQVVFNLVRNALEATEGRTPREIVVATRAATDAELEVSVADTGPGIGGDPEAVFQPFATTKTTGMGLGLSICRAIVEAHGGRLWAEPRPGGGAVFRFILPIAPSAEALHG